MTEMKKKKARWFGLLVLVFVIMATVGTVHMWLMPLCLAAMVVCLVKGELWEWGGIK